MAKIMKRSDRGFHSYGEPFRDTYGAELEVYESSSAEGPRVWLRIQGGHANDRASDHHVAHLNKRQALALIDRLQTWIDDIPSRWNK